MYTGIASKRRQVDMQLRHKIGACIARSYGLMTQRYVASHAYICMVGVLGIGLLLPCVAKSQESIGAVQDQQVAPGINTPNTTPPGHRGAFVILAPAGQVGPQSTPGALHVVQAPKISPSSPIQVVSPVDQGGPQQTGGISIQPPFVDPGLITPSTTVAGQPPPPP